MEGRRRCASWPAPRRGGAPSPSPIPRSRASPARRWCFARRRRWWRARAPRPADREPPSARVGSVAARGRRARGRVLHPAARPGRIPTAPARGPGAPRRGRPRGAIPAPLRSSPGRRREGAGRPEDPLGESGVLVIPRVVTIGQLQGPPRGAQRLSPEPRVRCARLHVDALVARDPHRWRGRRGDQKKAGGPGRRDAEPEVHGRLMRSMQTPRGSGPDGITSSVTWRVWPERRAVSIWNALQPGRAAVASPRPISTPSTFTRSETAGAPAETSPTSPRWPRSARPSGTDGKRASPARAEVRGSSPRCRSAVGGSPRGSPG